MDRSVIKKIGRRKAGTWGRAAKKVGKKFANRGTRRVLDRESKNG